MTILLFHACTPGEDVIGSEKNIRYVNTWIKNTLQDYYYWNDKLPTNSDRTLDPEEYFNSILYWYDPVTAPDGDRFSWIEKDYTKLISSLNGVVSNEIGFDMSLYYKDDAHNDLIGQINYVKKGTPAETAGIKRGMLFDKVNGTVLTLSNYGSLLTITKSDVTIGFVEPNYDDQGKVVSYTNMDAITLQTVSNYAENPVFLDTVISISGHKVGYFVYHFFAPDDGSKDNLYDLDMNAAFGRFKNAGITDMVLDLRYNSGGRTTSAQLLASELVPDLSDTKLFVFYRYNTELNSYFNASDLRTYFTTKVMDENRVTIGTVNNVGNLIGGKLYVLTGPYTASASEQVINGLKPFMNVVIIGDTTYGKNVASRTFYDEGHTDKNKWGMQPIIAKYFNSLGKSDFTAGFPPNFVVRDGGLNMRDFGDLNEPLLNKALNDILGTQVLPIAKPRAQSFRVDNLVGVPGKRIRGLELDKLPLFE
jgi:C-terminal processing protease CtpA/Prc